MVKNLLSVVVFLASSLAAHAQTFVTAGPLTGSAGVANTATYAPAKAQGTVDFTYFVGEFTGSNYDIFGLGPSSRVGETYDIGMQVPEEYAGYKVKSVSFVLYDATILSNVKAWASSSLPSSASAADACQDATETKSYNEGITTVNFSTPFTIPVGGGYVGYSFTMASLNSSMSNAAEYPVLTDHCDVISGGFSIKTSTMLTSWMHTFKDMGYKFNSTIIVSLEGEFSDNEATFPSSSLGDKYVAVNQTSTKQLNFSSFSVTPVTSLSYIVKDVATGKLSDEKTASNLGGIEYGKNGSFEVALDAEAATGIFEKEITITKVNGVANANTSNVGTLTLHVLAKALSRKIVEEEFTTTDCGWCPRGTAGMEMLEKTYPDNWIGIAAHALSNGSGWEDPMYSVDYDVQNLPMDLQVAGNPSCHLSRSIRYIDPYYGSSWSTAYPGYIVNDVNSLLEILPEAGVKVSAEWSADNNIVNVTAETEFAASYDESPFTLGFVLVGNGLKGTTEEWAQANYFSSYADYYGDDEYLRPWTLKPAKVTDMEYNHVALLTKGLVYGLEGSIASPVKLDEKQTYTTTFDLTDGVISYVTEENLIQDKSKLQVVALVINPTTLEIVNADECDITGLNTGIQGVESTSDNTVVARYSTSGQQISAPVKGVNIVKMANGQTKKVVVK